LLATLPDDPEVTIARSGTPLTNPRKGFTMAKKTVKKAAKKVVKKAAKKR
jgi:hypothetical protein